MFADQTDRRNLLNRRFCARKLNQEPPMIEFLKLIFITAAFLCSAQPNDVFSNNEHLDTLETGCNVTISSCDQSLTLYPLRDVCENCSQNTCVINFELPETQKLTTGWNFTVDYHPLNEGGSYKTLGEICGFEDTLQVRKGNETDHPDRSSGSLTLLEFDTSTGKEQFGSLEMKNRRIITCGNHQHNTAFNFISHSIVTLITREYSYEAIKIKSQCMRRSIFHTQSINSAQVFVYEESLEPDEFPKYPFSIKHEFINGTSPGVFADLINFNSSNPFVCLQLGDILNTCRMNNDTTDVKMEDTISSIATRLKLQLSPEYEEDGKMIDVQVILALSPEDFTSWNLGKIDNKYSQITLMFPAFKQQIKPKFDNFDQTVELILGPGVWDNLNLLTPEGELKEFSEMLSKLMKPGSIVPPVESVGTAVSIMSEFLKMSPSASFTSNKRTMFDANSGFLENVIELITEQIPPNPAMVLGKRTLETEVCESALTSKGYVIYSNLGRAGPYRSKDCIDEIRGEIDEIIILTPIYLNFSSKSSNESEKEDPCHRRDEYILISELWHNKVMKVNAFCNNMETYVSETNHVRISYLKNSETSFNRQLGYIFGLDILSNTSLTKKDLDAKLKNLDNSEKFLEEFWKNHPEVAEITMQDISITIHPEISYTYRYQFETQPFNLSASFFYDFIQFLSSENASVLITSPERTGDNSSFNGVLHFPVDHMEPKQLMNLIKEFSKREHLDLPVAHRSLQTQNESSTENFLLIISDYDECTFEVPVCNETNSDCINTDGSFFCDAILPERRTEDLNSTLKSEEEIKTNSGKEFVEDTSETEQKVLDKESKNKSTEKPSNLEHTKKADISLVIMGICILMIVLLLTGAYCVYKKKYKTHVYRVRRGRSGARP